MYLDEQKADSLHQAAVLADDYSLTHKTTFPSKPEQPGARSSVSDNKNSEMGRRSPPITRSRNQGQGRGSHFDSSCGLAGGPVCFYCKKHGHIMAECRTLEKKNATKKLNALVVPQEFLLKLLPNQQVTATNTTTLLFPRALFPYLSTVRRFLLTF